MMEDIGEAGVFYTNVITLINLTSQFMKNLTGYHLKVKTLQPLKNILARFLDFRHTIGT